MDIISLEQPIELAGLIVKSFPLGITEAFERLMELAPHEKTLYGITLNGADGVAYFVAAPAGALPPRDDLQPLTIPVGRYRCKPLQEWQKNLTAIPHFFRDLLSAHDVDHSAPCVEWYQDDTSMLCMIKLKDQ